MLNLLLRRIAAGLVGAVVAAVSAGAAAIAAAFALYALLRIWLPPPAAAAIDAGVFALVSGLIALLLPGLLRGTPAKAPARSRADGETARMAAEAGLAIIRVIAELVRPRPRRAKDKPSRETRRRRS